MKYYDICIQKLKNVVLQGDTWGSILASVQVDSIGKEVTNTGYGYMYKDKLPVTLLGLVDDARLSAIEQLARRINGVLQPFFDGLELQLVDFKLELGLNRAGELLLADEISPDTCRFWDQRSNDANDRILDKDRFRKDLGGVMEAYGEVLKRVHTACPNPRNCL